MFSVDLFNEFPHSSSAQLFVEVLFFLAFHTVPVSSKRSVGLFLAILLSGFALFSTKCGSFRALLFRDLAEVFFLQAVLNDCLPFNTS